MALAVVNGWYWYDYTASEKPAVEAFQAQHAAQMRVGKTLRAPAAQAEIIVFEIVGGPLVWPLPRFPTLAPKKLKTEPADIAKAGDSPSLRATLEELVGKPFDAIRKTAENARTAVNVLLFGGVAILLFNLYQRTRVAAEDEP